MKRSVAAAVHLLAVVVFAVPAFAQTRDGARAREAYSTAMKFAGADRPQALADCKANATQITPPATIQGTLTATSCIDTVLNVHEDVYKFTGTAGQVLTLDYSSRAFDVFLTVTGPQTFEFGDRISFLPPVSEKKIRNYTLPGSGTYYIEAEALEAVNSSNPSTGAYTLTVTLTGGSSGGGGSTTQIIPVAGHLNGAGGAAFRTDIKLFNPNSSTFTGSLLFTPWGQSQASSDASVRVSVAPNSVTFLNDAYLLAFPGGSGAARIAVVPDSGSPTTLVVDSSTYTANADGSELAQTPTVLTPASLASSGAKLVGVVGKSGERTNIFVMTGSADATITWTYRDANGVASPTITKTYVKDSTTQTSATGLLGFNPGPNSSLEARIDSGSARVALSPVNNINNQGRWVDFTARP